MRKRKILFLSERRADYSRLKPIMELVKKSNKFELCLVVTGLHFLKEFGETWKVIKQDGFSIDASIPLYKKNIQDDGVAMAGAFGTLVLSLTRVVRREKPDIIFCGFDTGASLASAVVGMYLNMPVVHLHGGERSGTVDESLRHAISKLSHIHFVATKESRERVIKLGENPKYVFCVGSTSLDTIKTITYPSRKQIFKKYNIDHQKPLILFSLHPVTTEADQVTSQIRESIKALSVIQKKYGAQVIAIYPNNDSGGKSIIKELKRSHFVVVPNIVYEDYLRLMNVADVLVGNSSAGIHEAPSFGLPTVNIGSRQQFRERGVNVIDVSHNHRSIRRSITRCLLDKKFRAKVKHSRNPYDHGYASKKIIHILETLDLPQTQKTLTY